MRASTKFVPLLLHHVKPHRPVIFYPSRSARSSSSHLRNAPPKIVVCKDLGPAMPLLTERGHVNIVRWTEDRRCDRAWLLENIVGASGIVVCFQDMINKEVVDAAGPNLRVVSTISVGYEHIDLRVMAENNIQVGYTPDILTSAVADFSLMLDLMASRNTGQSFRFVQNSQWPAFNWTPFAFCGPQLSTTASSPSRTAGFLGFGRISQAILARLIPFGLTDCIYTGRPGAAPQALRDDALQRKHGLNSLPSVSLDRLARESDVLFVLAPGGEATRHLVDKAFLRKMKPSSVLVNNSRGTLVDSDALLRALQDGWIWGAGLDVLDGEPNITADHPLVREPRCIVLPHIGSATIETRSEMATLTAQNVLAGVFGQPLPVALDLSSHCA
ncbi:hypothetical protein C8J57DRAFT_1295216 [Mycena rebaudengoi]|nr:hypothetical protein C8J57DRAFT_1295216 [Mycena rebaudengoi]